MINTIHLHRDDVETILQFINKYPDQEYVTITSDSSSGIGSIVKASIIPRRYAGRYSQGNESD